MLFMHPSNALSTGFTISVTTSLRVLFLICKLGGGDTFFAPGPSKLCTVSRTLEGSFSCSSGGDSRHVIMTDFR